jgi:hypothetical protein
MKYFFWIIILFYSCNSKVDTFTGTWKLYEIETGSDEIDKIMNKEIKEGRIVRIVTFTDSTWNEVYFANGTLKETLDWKYVVSSDNKYLMTTNEKGVRRDFKILEHTRSSYKILRDIELVATFIRIR